MRPPMESRVCGGNDLLRTLILMLISAYGDITQNCHVSGKSPGRQCWLPQLLQSLGRLNVTVFPWCEAQRSLNPRGGNWLVAKAVPFSHIIAQVAPFLAPLVFAVDNGISYIFQGDCSYEINLAGGRTSRNSLWE